MNKIINPDKETWINKFRFSTPIRIRFCETDAFGHVNNVSYFIYLEQARTDYVRELGLEKEFLDGKDTYIVTADVYCQYIGELCFGEDIEVKVRTSKIGNSSFGLEYAVLKQGTNNIVAAGKDTIVFVSSITKKNTPIPDSIKERIKNYEGIID